VQHEPIVGQSRRAFLQTSMAGAGLVLSGQFRLLGQAKEVSLNAWIRIAPDDTVTLIASQAEMGQGAGTTLPAILAEELCADWKRVRLEQSGVNDAYNNPRVNWQLASALKCFPLALRSLTSRTVPVRLGGHPQTNPTAHRGLQ
jgi:CO/xanthine dehydrogenase Mo-binding subunit